MNNNIALVMPYYGRLPAYFNFWLKSLTGMPFDVLIFTDISFSNVSCPPNVKVVPLSLENVRILAQQKLGTEVVIATPKKLCDLKPMYGKIFEAYLKGYAYWAFGDCDLVYGRAFSRTIREILLQDVDVASLRRHWPSGCFLLLRNTELICGLYRQAGNWKAVAKAHGGTSHFDECGGPWHVALENGTMTMSDCEARCDSFGAALWRQKELRFFHEDLVCETRLAKDYIHMDAGGRLLWQNREIPIFHYVGTKFQRYFRCIDVPLAKIGPYWIEKTGFFVTARQWRLRGLVRNWRFVRAFIASVRENGLRHWFHRIVRI